ncbi:MAG: hypothetical protein ACXACC_04880 [Promethearchaeota archaeon]|jgi:hypothetical protein
MRLLIEKEELFEEIKIYLKIFKLFKSYLILISDQEQMGIGNVTLASPPLIEGMKSTSTSYKLFGVEEELVSTIIAEKSSYILKAPVLLLTFIKSKKIIKNNIKPLVDFLNSSLNTIQNE